jgi:hypothetical protein
MTWQCGSRELEIVMTVHIAYGVCGTTVPLHENPCLHALPSIMIRILTFPLPFGIVERHAYG